MAAPLRLAVVGDRSPDVRAHARIPLALQTLARQGGPAVEPLWVGSASAGDLDVERFDGVWLTPGSPYRDRAGAEAAVGAARRASVPFLGTCGGSQHALIEFARNVAGLEDGGHAEYGDRGLLVVDALECSLVGEEGAVEVVPGTLAERALGARRSVERYHCAYGFVAEHRDRLERAGLRMSGFDDEGNVRMFELPGHPFFLGTLFQPELSSDAAAVHPIIRAFAAAMAGGRAARAAATAAA